jgi:hypothetical protein
MRLRIFSRSRFAGIWKCCGEGGQLWPGYDDRAETLTAAYSWIYCSSWLTSSPNVIRADIALRLIYVSKMGEIRRVSSGWFAFKKAKAGSIQGGQHDRMDNTQTWLGLKFKLQINLNSASLSLALSNSCKLDSLATPKPRVLSYCNHIGALKHRYFWTSLPSHKWMHTCRKNCLWFRPSTAQSVTITTLLDAQ